MCFPVFVVSTAPYGFMSSLQFSYYSKSVNSEKDESKFVPKETAVVVGAQIKTKSSGGLGEEEQITSSTKIEL